MPMNMLRGSKRLAGTGMPLGAPFAVAAGFTQLADARPAKPSVLDEQDTHQTVLDILQ